MRRLTLMLFLIGCESANAPAQDLAVAGEDLAVGDVADLGASDLASADLLPLDTAFCANLRLALVDGGVTTDCAAEYFARFIQCFQPAGSCFQSPQGIGWTECWDDGAKIAHSALLGNYGYRYRTASRACGSFTGNAPSTDVVYAQLCVSTNTYECGNYGDDMGGAPAAGSYYLGVFTCPDGAKVNIGPRLGGCPELEQALFPGCDGKGAADGGTCTYP